MGRCCAAWCYKKGALHRGGERKYFRRSPVSGRLTGSPFVASIAGQSLPASCQPGTQMDPLRISTPATPAILTAYATRKYFSVEFHALAEVRTAGGVREIQRALWTPPRLSQILSTRTSRRGPRAPAPSGVVVRWPWARTEVRSANYTDQVIAQIMASAAGASDGSALAAIETAARLWGAGLSSATVKPDNLALRSVSPGVLDSIGRNLCRSGESLHVIDVRNGRVMLMPCASWTVQGDADPDSWMYLATLNGPSTSRAITLPAASVLHVRYSPHPSRPWRGRSPMMMAADTAKAAGLLEVATSGELNFTQQQVLTPRRGAGDYALTDTLSPDTRRQNRKRCRRPHRDWRFHDTG